MKMKHFIFTSLIFMGIISACAGTAVTSDTQESQADLSIAQLLPDTEYPIEYASTGIAVLQDGFFEEPAAPDAATMTRIQLGQQQAFGDVNGDGTEDAAVTLIVDAGGSGTFTYLAMVVNENGTAKALPAVFLGDRIVVQSLVVKSGSVTVDILTRELDEPMSAEPKIETSLTFNIQGAELIEVK